MLHRLVCDVAGLSDVRIAHRAGGEPFLPERPDLAVSVSRDGGWVAAAVGHADGIGIDVQCPQPVRAARLRRCGSSTARVALAALPDLERDLEYARIWTVQEACVKATGAGLAGRPWTIPVEVGQWDGAWRACHWHSLRGLGVPVSVAKR